jgi:hypothetical protein
MEGAQEQGGNGATVAKTKVVGMLPSSQRLRFSGRWHCRLLGVRGMVCVGALAVLVGWLWTIEMKFNGEVRARPAQWA